MFGIKRAHRAEDSGREETDRKSEHEDRRIAGRKRHVGDYGNARPQREYQEREPPADAIRQETGRQITAESASDQHGEITGRIDNRKSAFGTQKSREPGRYGVI